ncbi:hemolysin, partial [Vibrio parahaemolyticus]|nr:hemolysin [Vibrio parahaemolyticus]
SGVKQVIKGFQYGEMEPVEVDLPSDGVQTIESEASTENEENVEVFTISE